MAAAGQNEDLEQTPATAVRAPRHRTALVHDNATTEERAAYERELWLPICDILTYSSRPRADVVDFPVVDANRLADVPETVPDATAVPSRKARVLVALAMAAAPLARRFGVTVLDSFAEPLVPPPVTGEDTPLPVPEAVRRAA